MYTLLECILFCRRNGAIEHITRRGKMTGASWLKKVETLKELNDDERKSLSKYILENTFRAGEKLYEQDEEGGKLYFIKSGKVKVLRKGKTLKEHELASMGEGNIFGAMTFFDRGKHTAEISVQEDAVVGVLSIEQFEKMATDDPHLAYIVTKGLLVELQRIMHNMNQQYVSLMEYMYVFGK